MAPVAYTALRYTSNSKYHVDEFLINNNSPSNTSISITLSRYMGKLDSIYLSHEASATDLPPLAVENTTQNTVTLTFASESQYAEYIKSRSTMELYVRWQRGPAAF